MDLVQLGRWLVLLFIVLTPFIGNERWLRAHMVAVPLVFAHWIFATTFFPPAEVERLATGKDTGDTYLGQVVMPLYKNESFLGKALEPVVTFKDAGQEKMVIWAVLVTLWVITLQRLGITPRRTAPR